MNYDKIFLIASIWYCGWFFLSFIGSNIFNNEAPHIRIFGFDLLGSNIVTFIPSVIYLLWRYL